MNSAKKSKCPRLYISIFEKLVLEKDVEALTGDFEELYDRAETRYGKIYALIWFVLLAIKLMPSIIYNKTFWTMIMLKNYWKVAFRILMRQKIYSLITVIGLAIGFGVFIFFFRLFIWSVSADHLVGECRPFGR